MKRLLKRIMYVSLLMLLFTRYENIMASEVMDSAEFNEEFADINYSETIESANIALNRDFKDADAEAVVKIPLYDLNEERMGFLIPAIEDEKTVGYVVMIAKDNYYEMLTSSRGEKSAELVDLLLNVPEEHKIIYNFPFNFIVVQEDGNSYEINTENNSITDLGLYTSNDLTDKPYVDIEQYINVRKPLLAKAPRVLIDNGALKKWKYGEFVKVLASASSSTYYYGGYQSWLTTELTGTDQITTYWSDRACGVAAACNVAVYLSQNMSGKSALYNKGTLTKANYTKNMRDIYDYLTPAVWGIPTIGTMKSKVEAFASSRKVSLSGYISDTNWTKDNVIRYIRNGLNADSPVLMITWNSSVSSLQNHWVTITRSYFENGTNYIVTSNWSDQKTYNFDTWFDGGSLYQGILYFK